MLLLHKLVGALHWWAFGPLSLLLAAPQEVIRMVSRGLHRLLTCFAQQIFFCWYRLVRIPTTRDQGLNGFRVKICLARWKVCPPSSWTSVIGASLWATKHYIFRCGLGGQQFPEFGSKILQLDHTRCCTLKCVPTIFRMTSPLMFSAHNEMSIRIVQTRYRDVRMSNEGCPFRNPETAYEPRPKKANV